ncbi:hypothetical protein C8Q75DRAFT_802631 [Abortiporus biennis]|nr:hypothetical protein C8Q75DRAFT_802631 [Abortiporus biennis]
MRWLSLLIGGLYFALLHQLIFAQTEITSVFSNKAVREDDDPKHASVDGDHGVAAVRQTSFSASSSDTSSTTQPTSHRSGTLAIPSTTHFTPNRTHTPIHTRLSVTQTHSLPITIHHGPPGMVPTSQPHPPQAATSGSHSKKQPVVAIVFEVLAGIAGLAVILGLVRCFYVWKRTPSRDRIQTLLSRHRLEREMEELEREDLQRRMQHVRRTSLYRPPPPPYLQAPAYDEVVCENNDHAHDHERPPPTQVPLLSASAV